MQTVFMYDTEGFLVGDFYIPEGTTLFRTTTKFPLSAPEQRTSKFVNGEWVLVEPDTRDYVARREAAYPPVEEQLDIQYHFGYDFWRDMVAQIKKRNPKFA